VSVILISELLNSLCCCLVLYVIHLFVSGCSVTCIKDFVYCQIVNLVVVMLVLNAGPKDLVVQLTIHPIVLNKLS